MNYLSLIFFFHQTPTSSHRAHALSKRSNIINFKMLVFVLKETNLND